MSAWRRLLGQKAGLIVQEISSIHIPRLPGVGHSLHLFENCHELPGRDSNLRPIG